MITKAAIVNGTYQLMRISGLTRKAGPEEIDTAIQVADDYAEELKTTGLDVNWQQPSTYGESDANDTSGLTVTTAGPFKKLLLLQLVAYFGKEIPRSVMLTANAGMKALEHLLVSVPDAELPPTLPFGSGNEWDYRDRKFYNEPPVNNGASYVFKDEVLNYEEDFSAWLVDETLVSVAWETSDTGITIGTNTFTDTVATAELTFAQIGGYSVQIKATKTNSTDVKIINKNFVIDDASPVGLRFP